MFKKVLITSVVLSLSIACHKDDAATTTTSSNVSSTAAATAAAPKDASKKVDLAPLPLTVKLPRDETPIAMDMSMGDNKSVSVSYDAVGAGINVSEPLQKNFGAVKKEYKADTILFPFKRWVKEGDSTAVEEFTNEGKTGYMALSWKQVGGKTYLCKSNGLSGLKTADDAEKVLAACDSLAVK